MSLSLVRFVVSLLCSSPVLSCDAWCIFCPLYVLLYTPCYSGAPVVGCYCPVTSCLCIGSYICPLIFGVFIPPLFLVLILGYAPDLVFLTLILSCFCPENRAFISRFDFGHCFFKSHFEIPAQFWDARFQNPAYFFRFFFLNLDLGFPPPFWIFDPPLDFSALRLFSSVVMYQSI